MTNKIGSEGVSPTEGMFPADASPIPLQRLPQDSTSRSSSLPKGEATLPSTPVLPLPVRKGDGTPQPDMAEIAQRLLETEKMLTAVIDTGCTLLEQEGITEQELPEMLRAARRGGSPSARSAASDDSSGVSAYFMGTSGLAMAKMTGELARLMGKSSYQNALLAIEQRKQQVELLNSECDTIRALGQKKADQFQALAIAKMAVAAASFFAAFVNWAQTKASGSAADSDALARMDYDAKRRDTTVGSITGMLDRGGSIAELYIQKGFATEIENLEARRAFLAGMKNMQEQAYNTTRDIMSKSEQEVVELYRSLQRMTESLMRSQGLSRNG
jgi:hypothetical protein